MATSQPEHRHEDNVEYVPGVRSARALRALGMSEEGTVRGLMDEIGLSRDEAILAVTVAECERLSHGRDVARRSRPLVPSPRYGRR